MSNQNESAARAESPGLGTLLIGLRQRECHNFDPIRFSYLEAMARRAQGQGESVGHIVEQLGLAALEQYSADLALAQEEAAACLDTAGSAQAEELQELFQACKYREMKRLLTRARRSTTNESLVAMSTYISNPEPVAAKHAVTPSFDDILRAHEQELIQTGGNSSVQEQGRAEHSAIHHFREALVKRNADKLVTKLINEIPEDAGPLNPQKLIVQSLASMRDLSPHYLNRFVAYIDTLLWLERAGGK